MQTVRDYQKIYGSIYRLCAVKRVAFMVSDPKICEIILSNPTKNLSKSRLYSMLSPWLGEGLLLSSGAKWFTRRKIITPAFHFSILKQFIDIFDSQSRILVERLSEHCTGNIVNIHPFITLMALDVMCEAAMGTKINAQTNPNNEYVKAVAT